jgi:glutamate/tyrosine decarboxylase-like PLP-dependent enzyme
MLRQVEAEQEDPPVADDENHSHAPDPAYPLSAWFLGPRAENAAVWQELFDYIFQDYVHWRRNYFPSDPVVVNRVQRRSDSHEAWVDSLTAALDETLNKLKQHFPFHSPRYIAHMLSEQTLPSVLGYFAGMLFNPNNVTAEAAPITVELELEVGRMVAAMLGFNPKRAWAHITSGGTVANLEALWVARTVQFAPLMVQEFCAARHLPFRVHRPNGSAAAIADLGEAELLALQPNEAILMWRKLARYLHEEQGQPVRDVLAQINEHVAGSQYNVSHQGLPAVIHRVGLRPVIFVSAAAHYSIVKTANILGYGEAAVRSVPVTPRFQIDMSELRSMLAGLASDEYVAAVVGIVGSTEEGAVDPIHAIHFLREERERDLARSFWFHVDAAWGGYIRSLFCGLNLPHLPHGSSLETICDQYVRALHMEDKVTLDAGARHKVRKSGEVRWADRDIYAAFLAMADADSTTVDPHKMGFTPYPAGIVAFRNGLVTEHIVERAQYISDEAGGIKAIDQPLRIEAVGPYIVEGSKPGAAALSCFLAHKTIPLDMHGHGQIVRTTLLSAKKLCKHLANHRHLFDEIHAEVTGEERCHLPFTFAPLFEPDTNIVCFVARPMRWEEGKLASCDWRLPWLNLLNELIYGATSIAPLDGRRPPPAVQPFFVSRTRFEQRQYTAESIAVVLERIGVGADDYRRHGLFVLRSTVMNPWYGEAEQVGADYLRQFVHHLHGAAAAAMQQVEQARSKIFDKSVVNELL